MIKIGYRNFLLALLSILFFNLSIKAQKDSLSTLKKVRPYIAPSILIGTGLYVNTINNQFSKQSLQQRILNKYSNVNTNVDDFLIFVPVGQLYLGKSLGFKSRNNFFNKSKNLFLSQLCTGLITYGLKVSTAVTRPDGTQLSFPSGHTSMAFSSATTLFYEYKDQHPIYASSGFIFASTTGSLRVLNNRHWVSDVLVGAGIGIIVTHLIYHFEPLKNWNPFKPKTQKTAKLFY